MSYLTDTYQKMGAALDPTEDYFEEDSRFLTLEQILSALPKGKFCDLGCGRGAIIRRLAQHHEVYGTEYDPSLVELCQSAGLRVAPIDLNEAADLPFPGVVFDALLISEVCEHLLDPRHALGLAKQVLRQGGTLVVTVPNAVPLFVRLPLLMGSSVDWLHYPSFDTETTAHIRFYTVESMSRLLEQLGFAVREVRGVSFRMNGRFWERLCYWLSRLTMNTAKSAPARLDAWFGRKLPGLSPGLVFICEKR